MRDARKNVDSLVCRDIMLSIIVPVYNTEKYLAKCLDSIIQALEKVEIKTEVLVINDGSTDNSKIVIEKYKNEHPQLIAAYDKPNGGLSDVKNFGLDHAKGEFISFIDSDDFVDPVFKDVAAKIYEQYETGQINPAAIISSYMDTSMHNEIAAMFSAELSDSLNKLEREKTLNDTVIKVKKNSLDTKLDNATDARAMQDIINQQMKLNNIHINL